MGDKIQDDFAKLLEDLRAEKPEDRSELSRATAVTITEVEKAMAFYMFWVEPLQ